MKKKILILSLMILALIGCDNPSVKNTSADSTNIEKEKVKSVEVGIEDNVKESIEKNYKAQLDALNNKDIKEFKSLFYSDLSPQSVGYLQEVMELDGEYSLKNLDVVYQKDDEAVVVWETVLITKKIDPSYNYNQRNKGVEVFKKTEQGWKSISDFFYEDISTVFLDENGKPDPEYKEDNTNFESVWMPEIERLQKEKLEPIIWFHNVFGSLYTSEY